MFRELEIIDEKLRATPVAIMGMTLPPQKGYKKSASEETLNRTAYFISMKNGQKSNAMLMHVQLLLVERGERVQQVVSVRQSAIVHDGQFAVNPAPVTNRHRPFLRGLKRRQIERF